MIILGLLFLSGSDSILKPLFGFTIELAYWMINFQAWDDASICAECRLQIMWTERVTFYVGFAILGYGVSFSVIED